MQPWQPLLDWWFGAADATAAEVAASRSALWFGKQDSQDCQARQRCHLACAQRRPVHHGDKNELQQQKSPHPAEQALCRQV